MGITLLITGCILVVALVALVIARNASYGTYKLGYIVRDTLVEKGSGTVYFARKSCGVVCQTGGTFVAKLEEGQKVEAGGIIGYITDGENKNVLTKLEQVNNSIATLQKLEESESGVIESDELLALRNEIKAQELLLAEIGATGNLSEMSEITEKLNALITERDEIIIQSESVSESINSLKRQKSELETVIATKMTPVVSSVSGTVSYSFSSTDGVESELYDLVKSKDSSVPGRLADLEAEPQTAVGNEVSAGQQVARIISELDYYIIMKTDSSIENLSSVITLSSEGGFQTTGTVTDSETYPGYIIINTLRGIKTSLGLKKADVTYDIDKVTGYCVPLTALTDWDKTEKTARLAVVKSGYAEFVYVGIVAHDDTKAIISSTTYSDSQVIIDGVVQDSGSDATFKGGDCYVVNADGVKDGMLIE